MKELIIYNNISGLTFKPAIDYVKGKDLRLFNKLDTLKNYINKEQNKKIDIVFIAHGFSNEQIGDNIQVCFLAECQSTVHDVIKNLDDCSNIRSILFLCCYTSNVDINFENIEQVISYKGFIRSDIMPIIIENYYKIIHEHSNLENDYKDFILNLEPNIKTELFERDLPK